ncbi:MAG TPA: hypothetical protein VNT42_01575 [Sphingomonas sp.]|nr:hypothetical protein [Sphingomonas sp.]
MIDLGYVLGSALIAMVVVVRGYPLVQPWVLPLLQRWRAEGKFSVGRAISAVTQGSSV